MHILLDTHVALWAIANDARLPQQARELILTESNEVFVSVASIWEVAIKHSLARAKMPISGGQANAWFRQAGYRILPIAAEHAVGVEELPVLHGDPFDRLLVSQALLEPLRLITHDQMVARYSDTIILV